MKTKDEYAEDFIINNLSFGELVALKYDIPLSDDETSGFDGYNFGGNYNNYDGLSFDGGFVNAGGKPITSSSGVDRGENKGYSNPTMGFDGSDNAFSDFNKKARQKLGSKIKSGASKVGGAIKSVGSGVKNTIKKVGDKIGDSKIGQAIKNSKVGGGIVSGIQKVGGKIGSGLNNLKDKAGTVIKKVGDKIGDGLKAVGRGVVVATLSIPSSETSKI